MSDALMPKMEAMAERGRKITVTMVKAYMARSWRSLV
jgi:hypothetical protein